MLVGIHQLWNNDGRACGRSPKVTALQPYRGDTRIHPVHFAAQGAGYKIDVDDWHKHVHHTLPYEKYLKRDDKLISLLQQIQLPLYVFTNGDRKHAEICLQLMGITSLFKVPFLSLFKSAAVLRLSLTQR